MLNNNNFPTVCNPWILSLCYHCIKLNHVYSYLYCMYLQVHMYIQARPFQKPTIMHACPVNKIDKPTDFIHTSLSQKQANFIKQKLNEMQLTSSVRKLYFCKNMHPHNQPNDHNGHCQSRGQKAKVMNQQLSRNNAKIFGCFKWTL